jgi:asparagine synthase (glutamine-hydrolysing)
MCGIAGIFGERWREADLAAMVAAQHHRGPDASGMYVTTEHEAGLGHNRLSILDLSEAGRQPMWNAAGTVANVFNGEVYNYLELREQLPDYPFRSRTDTEVLLAAYEKWGDAFVDRLIGMFTFLIWDQGRRRLFAARDRFGVKPLYYHQRGPTLRIASEIKALQAGGAETAPDPSTWADYLVNGLSDHSERTFWTGIRSLPPGHRLTWENGTAQISRWYDLAEKTAEPDTRPEAEVAQEYLALLADSVRLRFRSDVPVGINLSGGLDSSTLLGLVQRVQGESSDVKAFTFTLGDPNYDELPWVTQMLRRTRHPLIDCRLEAHEVPALAESVAHHQDEPFGGLPTLAYARLFEIARREGVIVLLDGQGMDEQWAGYDYYARVLEGKTAGLVQGTADRPVRPECLLGDFAALASGWQAPRPFGDALRDTQYRDARHTKIPRALRFNDRVSMRSSTELREPFLDHRLFELALRQPAERKISGSTHKRMLRKMAADLLPEGIVEAPKRPLQTPQREWLRGPLRRWAEDRIEAAIAEWQGVWLDGARVRREWSAFVESEGGNSFFVWQWISLAMAPGAVQNA